MSRRRSRGRKVNGILVLDKPAGMTSNAALQEAKRLFNAAKAGHTGSLDPIATGVLPLCFGEATKFSQFLLNADKRYLATLKLGEATETGDADGEVVASADVPELERDELDAILEQFRGEIEQIPSMYSAIKVDGQPLYKLARQGIEVERKARTVRIHELSITDFEDELVTLEISCSKGTYIRSIAEDLGRVLGCGAHVVGLRRLASGPYDLAASHTLEELKDLKENSKENKSLEAIDALLEPEASAVRDWPSVELTELTASYLRQGQAVQISHAPTKGWVRIFSASDDTGSEFLGVGEILEDGRVAPRRLVAAH
jgi:tRNA pseudouridine55 synthase